MKSGIFNKMYIANVAFSIQHAPHIDIERELVRFEDGLKNLFEEAGQLTRVPRNADPQIPRFVFQNNSGKRLEISPVRSVLSFNFKNIGIDKACSLFKKNVTDFFAFLKKQPWLKLDGFNSYIIINMPLKDKTHNMLEEIKNQFINFQAEGQLLKTAVSIKVKKENHNFEYVIGEYSEIKHDIKIDKQNMSPNPQKELYIKLSNDSGTLLEKGLRLSIIVEDIFNFEETESPDIKASFDCHVKDVINEVQIAPQKIIFERE
ncbi:MAG: hypothetical protein HUN04_14745 [Desulfobacter sp.]|nr:MAG: hypothetical protein HUN04_14745 [Desulfobacter sp.]